MNTTEAFYLFAEEIVDSLKTVPFKELNSYEGREYTWKRGRREGSLSITIEIISPEYKRVTIDGSLPGRIFRSQGHPFRKRFRAYENGVRVPEVQE